MYHNPGPLVEEQPVGIRVVEISRWPIEHYTILKFERMVGSGGEAKAMAFAGQVLPNGKVEIQARKKWPVIR